MAWKPRWVQGGHSAVGRRPGPPSSPAFSWPGHLFLLLLGFKLPQVLSRTQKSFLVKSLQEILAITLVRLHALKMVTTSPDFGFWNLILPDPLPFFEL